ncbi:transporter [Solimonas marina]|uniref:Transporter n=1 Tax=Solimonas marina TaxID=2714601 RepID=A0A970B5L0_9GAMM|nr:transporter [Solimonas marina]NKF23512.1 transporter [Solimonas marina]
MRLIKRVVGAALAPVLMSVAAPALAVDVDPGDYTALPAGTNLGLVYLQQVHRDELSTPAGTIDDARLDSSVMLARYVHFTKIGPFTVDPQVIVPFGKLYNGQVAGSDLDESSGLGDIVTFATVWLVNKPDPKHETYFGVSPILTIPTGAYGHDKSVNLGGNRFVYTAQAGLIQGLAQNLKVDLIGELTWYQDNDKYGAAEQTLSQAHSGEFQAWLRYGLPDGKTTVSAGYANYWGGKQKVDGVYNGSKTEHQQVRLAIQSFVTPTVQLEAIVGRDTEVQDGFRQDAIVQLRALKLF